jgi:hypothetical protein
MPASNPRLTITLKPSTAATLRRLSELTGNSQSALISELLDVNEAALSRLVTVLQAATDAKLAINEEMASGLHLAQQQLEQQLGLSLEVFDTATAPILDEAERVVRRRAKSVRRLAGARSDGGGATPMSNRGVRLTTTKAKKSTRRRG